MEDHKSNASSKMVSGKKMLQFTAVFPLEEGCFTCSLPVLAPILTFSSLNIWGSENSANQSNLYGIFILSDLDT